MTIDLRLGDCRDVMASMPEASVDSIVTDPPAGIGFMGIAWDANKGGRRHWIQWLTAILVEALRVLKPGGHALVWALPRTSHWTATALEDAGFEIRDVITHHFGQGFPKSLNGAHGGTALKPASEHWILARKPLDGTVAETFAEHGTGGLNIDACRIGWGAGITRDLDDTARARYPKGGNRGFHLAPGTRGGDASGRWPANVVLSHPEQCELIGATSVAANGSVTGAEPSAVAKNALGERERAPFAAHGNGDGTETVERWLCAAGCPVAALNEQAGDVGSHGGFVRVGQLGFKGGSLGAAREVPASTGLAARFFYCAKASPAERGAGNDWPTVKPLALMRYLIRLITPKGGTLLDFFHGSGTTLVAAVDEGFDVIGIDADPRARAIAEKRLADAAGPLFAGRTAT